MATAYDVMDKAYSACKDSEIKRLHQNLPRATVTCRFRVRHRDPGDACRLRVCNHFTILGSQMGRPPRRTGTVHRLTNRKARICITPDHAPPHFHVRGPGWAISIEIRTLAIMVGWAPARELSEALEWAAQPRNRATLMNKWDDLNERED
jgi:hypothetical protein